MAAGRLPGSARVLLLAGSALFGGCLLAACLLAACLLAACLLGGCFESPQLEGRLCSASAPCPASYICDVDGRCHRPCRGDDECASPERCGGDGRCHATSMMCEAMVCNAPPSECFEPAGECDPDDGTCSYLPKASTSSCSDGNACTAGDTCEGGDCRPGPTIDCDDHNPCTDEACDPARGCLHTNNTAACDDGDDCTLGDVCAGGSCHPGVPRTCEDGNDCTTDGCSPASGCTFTTKADSTPCTFAGGGSGSCMAGACVGCLNDTDCDDGNPCTDDRCSAGTCAHANNRAPCDDGDLCTYGDACSGGRCLGTAIVCAGNTCVTRSCNGTATCTEVFHSGVACADDGDPCTRDVCNGTGSCGHNYLGDGVMCGASSAQRCCSGSCVNISANSSHCGGCGSACAPGLACESVSVTNTCSPAPAGVTGRCRCQASNAQCPRGQVCRNVTPFSNRCAPPAQSNCAPGETFVDIAGCPNFCRY